MSCADAGRKAFIVNRIGDFAFLIGMLYLALEFVKGIPMRRFGEFSDLDGPLLLLASDASTYMTGSVVVVDGGHICASL